MAATTFYVDGDGDFTTAQTGAIGAAFGGPYGLQKALDTSLAGISFVYAKATACRLDRLVKLTVQDITGLSWAVGDAYVDNNGGAEWAGTLCEIISVTSIVVELTVASGKYYANVTTASGINNTTRTSTRTLSAKAGVAIDIDQNIGAVAARLSIIGCKDDASWTVDGTRFVLDANGVAPNCIVNGAAADYWTLRNFELDAANGDCFDSPNAYSDGVELENIYAHHSVTGMGIDAGSLRTSTIRKCRSTDNATIGFYLGELRGQLVACEAVANGTDGFSSSSSGINFLSDCISHGNVRDNVASNGPLAIFNSVVDSAGRHGINNGGYALFLTGVRVTNNGNAANEFGVNMATGSFARIAHCLFTGNRQAGAADGDFGGAAAGNVIQTEYDGTNTNILDGAAAPNDGYTNVGTHDFNLTTGARLRSVADLLPDT